MEIKPWRIYPQYKFKKVWDTLIILLMVYTCIYVPYKVAFVRITNSKSLLWETLIDFLFLCDICLNFFTAIEYKINKQIFYESRYSVLASKYLSSWFFWDIISIIPLQMFEKLITRRNDQIIKNRVALRMIRVPRLYTLI